MSTVVQPLAQVRESVCAIMRIIKKQRKAGKKKPPVVEFGLSFVGTAWCIKADKLLLSAHHILNGGKPRDPNNLFYAFSVPANGPVAYHFQIVGFPLEDPASDMAVLEVGPPPKQGIHIPQAPVTFTRPPDGSRVFTYGFPAPEIAGANLDRDGRFLGGGQFFLKAHANEGIVASQYDYDGAWHYEFNIGWHHGESGGPVFREDIVAAITIMQHYRNVKTPHGIFPGPHRGRSLESIRQQLIDFGAKVV